MRTAEREGRRRRSSAYTGYLGRTGVCLCRVSDAVFLRQQICKGLRAWMAFWDICSRLHHPFYGMDDEDQTLPLNEREAGELPRR
ncbi:unnamed protein product [Arctogadus glacialis]